ncbi:MAG: PAS domain S-box protein [Candidatus Thorarchaeota archaeon]
MKNSIKQENRYFKNILDSIYDEIMILDKDFSIRDVNKTFCCRYGINREQVIGKKCYKITHGINKVCSLPECKCPVEDVLKTSKFNESIHSHYVNDDEIYLEILTYPIKNDRGDIEQIVKIGRNISEWKKTELILKESDEKFRNLTESFPYSIILLDYKKQIYDCNSSAELYLNRNKDNLKKAYFFDILNLNKKQMDSFNVIFQNVLEYDLNEIMEFEIINSSGEKSWLQAFFSMCEIEDNKFVQVMLQDITDRILAEKIIREENKRLRDFDNIKQNMTTRVSEQLRNPLNVLTNTTDIILNSYKDKLDFKIIKLLELIKNEGENSLDLVGKIVNISRIESDKLILNKQTNSLVEIILKSIDSLNENEDTKKIKTSIMLSEDFYSEVDKLRIKQVLKEIISYIRMNTNNQDILIDLKRVNNFGEIEIRSQLCQSVEKNIFQELSFSKQIVDLHHGKLYIESRDNTNTFLIQLPLKEWRSSLIHLYIICKSGIPLFDCAFNELIEFSDSSLISGGIIGLMTILKAILKGDEQIKSIDHGDRTIIFNLNSTKDVVFVLIVKENINVLERKLNALIKEFDATYNDLIENIEKTCSERDKWTGIIYLVQKHFGTLEYYLKFDPNCIIL